MAARVVVVREYRVRCEKCAALGYAETDWTVFDAEARRTMLAEHVASARHQKALEAQGE